LCETAEQSAEPFPSLERGTEWNDLLFGEIFAGAAQLSRAHAKRNFRVSSVDHAIKRSTELITFLDLTKDKDLHFFRDFLEAELNVLVYIHLAPPGGTASAARGIPVSGCP